MGLLLPVVPASVVVGVVVDVVVVDVVVGVVGVVEVKGEDGGVSIWTDFSDLLLLNIVKCQCQCQVLLHSFAFFYFLLLSFVVSFSSIFCSFSGTEDLRRYIFPFSAMNGIRKNVCLTYILFFKKETLTDKGSST